jgi:hypothetical protein
LDRGQIVRVFGPIDRAQNAKIVIERNDNAENRNRNQPVITWPRRTLFQRRFEEQKFSEESRQRRNARQ